MKDSIILLCLSMWTIALVIEAQSFAPYLLTRTFTHADGQHFEKLYTDYSIKGVTLAYLNGLTGCKPGLNYDRPLDDSDIRANLVALKKKGVKIILSTGGEGNHTLEGKCQSVRDLSAAYKDALKAAQSTHLDINLGEELPIDLVTKAVALLQDHQPTYMFSVTAPANAQGLKAYGLKFLNSSVKNGANFTYVNAFAANFKAEKAWGTVAPAVVEAVNKQLKGIWGEGKASVYSRIGLHVMIGRNYVGKTFTLNDAGKVVSYANKKGLAHLSFHALGRDNANCAPESKQPTIECSGIVQEPHAFSAEFSKFNAAPIPGEF